MAVVEGFRQFSDLLRCSRVLVKTDQRALSFIFSRNTSRIKSEKLVRWRLELSQYNFDISYHKGCDNVSADALSRLASLENNTCQQLHRDLAHAGDTRLYEYVQRYKLPFSVQEVRQTATDCQTCALWKPKFYQPPKQQLIQSTRPWERLSIDIVGPKEISQSGNQYLLTVIDKYSRFTFAFPLRKITSSSVKGCLAQLFSIFGPPSFIHSDRGTQFQSEEFQEFCFSRGIGLSRTSPYHPKGNGRTKDTTVSSGSPYSAFSTRKAGKALPGRISCLEHCPPFEPSSTPLPAKRLTIGCSTSQGRQEEVSSPRRGGYEPAVMRT